jgi:hypothetical protein
VDQAQDISNKIAQLIGEAPGGTMLGVRLGASLRAYFPNFNPYAYQCRNLRQFIASYVPAVSEKGRSGADLVYGIADPPIRDAAPIPQGTLFPHLTEPEYGRLPMSSYNWKAYSNPGHPFVVTANRETGMLQALPQGSNPPEPWVVLPKPTAAFHSEIANEFASSVPEPSRANLKALLRDPKWYLRFSGIVTREGLGAQWGAFRRRKLIERLNSSLSELGIPSTPRISRKFETHQQISSLKTTRTSVAAGTEESVLRDLICKVVCELPMSELRSLKLPVGVVFDALTR